MRCAKPSTTAVLPKPGSPIKTGLFFVRRERICMIRSISVSRPTTGSSLPSAASLVKLRPNWSSSLEDFLPSPGPEPAPEQDVLGADVVVAQAERLAQRELEHLLGARREGDLPGGDLLTRADDPHDLRAHPLNGDVKALQHARGQPLLRAQQPEQDVLRAYVVVLERPRLLLRENDHLTGPFCESLEHGAASFLRGGGASSGWRRRSCRQPHDAFQAVYQQARGRLRGRSPVLHGGSAIASGWVAHSREQHDLADRALLCKHHP